MFKKYDPGTKCGVFIITKRLPHPLQKVQPRSWIMKKMIKFDISFHLHYSTLQEWYWLDTNKACSKGWWIFPISFFFKSHPKLAWQNVISKLSSQLPKKVGEYQWISPNFIGFLFLLSVLKYRPTFLVSGFNSVEKKKTSSIWIISPNTENKKIFETFWNQFSPPFPIRLIWAPPTPATTSPPQGRPNRPRSAAPCGRPCPGKGSGGLGEMVRSKTDGKWWKMYENLQEKRVKPPVNMASKFDFTRYLRIESKLIPCCLLVLLHSATLCFRQSTEWYLNLLAVSSFCWLGQPGVAEPSCKMPQTFRTPESFWHSPGHHPDFNRKRFQQTAPFRSSQDARCQAVHLRFYCWMEKNRNSKCHTLHGVFFALIHTSSRMLTGTFTWFPL